jgi:hypothetical protein
MLCLHQSHGCDIYNPTKILNLAVSMEQQTNDHLKKIFKMTPIMQNKAEDTILLHVMCSNLKQHFPHIALQRIQHCSFKQTAFKSPIMNMEKKNPYS